MSLMFYHPTGYLDVQCKRGILSSILNPKLFLTSAVRSLCSSVVRFNKYLFIAKRNEKKMRKSAQTSLFNQIFV